MITTTKRTTTRRATTTTTTAEAPTGRGVPRRALADGVVERRRTPRRRDEPAPAHGLREESAVPGEAGTGEAGAPALGALSASEHYQRELRRRADRVAGDLATLLAEAKAEYEAQINAPRPAGKGGRPKKKVAPADEIELSDDDALGPADD